MSPVVQSTSPVHRSSPPIVYSPNHGMFKYVEDLLAKEVELESLSSDKSIPPPDQLEDFKVVQAFCIKRNIKISLRDLRDFVLSHMNRSREGNGYEVSIIFISWQGRFTHPLADSDVKNYINNCRLQFSQPFHSEYIIKTANRYLNSLGFHGQPFLSVHIRFEKLIVYAHKRDKSIDAYLDCCMKRLSSLMSIVTEKFNIPAGNVLLN